MPNRPFVTDSVPTLNTVKLSVPPIGAYDSSYLKRFVSEAVPAISTNSVTVLPSSGEVIEAIGESVSPGSVITKTLFSEVLLSDGSIADTTRLWLPMSRPDVLIIVFGRAVEMTFPSRSVSTETLPELSLAVIVIITSSPEAYMGGS